MDHQNKLGVSYSKKAKDGNPVVKPTSVLAYSRSMDGVNLMDHQLQSSTQQVYVKVGKTSTVKTYETMCCVDTDVSVLK